MKISGDIWEIVRSRAPHPRSEQVSDLRNFLKDLDNPHARALSGPWRHESCDQASAQALEAWVADRIRAGKLTLLQAQEWLRLTFEAIGEFNKDGRTLFPTRLAVVANPSPSPFSPVAMRGSVCAQQWRIGLHNWIMDSSSCICDDDWIAAISLSAVFHGVLLDIRKLTLFIEKIERNEGPVVDAGIGNVRYNLPFLGRGNHQLQRWFIDPLTEMLVWRYLHKKGNPTKIGLIKKINAFLLKQGIAKKILPKNLSEMADFSQTWWSEHAAHVDLHCARRSISYHGIHDRSWCRFQHLEYDPQANRIQNMPTKERALDESSVEVDLLLLNPWLARALRIIENTDIGPIKQAIEKLLLEQSEDKLSSVYLGWLSAMLNGKSASRNSLRLSTVRKRFGAAAPRLLSVLGTDNPADLETMELEDHYAELCVDVGPLAPTRELANGLRDFHSYLVKNYGKPHIHSEEEVFGDANALKPVDANLINFDEYQKAQAWLDQQVNHRQNIPICKIVLALAFKTGARRMEIFGLQLRDIHSIGGLTCLIRKNPRRRLKTDNAKRKLDWSALLSLQEQRLLTTWLEKRKLESPDSNDLGGNESYLFKEFELDSSEFWVNTITGRVCEAVRAVTGDKALFLHHLRHSYATWTFLRLRAPDLPGIEKYFENFPATVFALRTGIRLRTQLFWRNPKVTRAYDYVVARILGHSSPYVSFAHYIHASDFILGSLAMRECCKVRKAVLLSASGLQKSSAYEHHGQSLTELLNASRKMYAALNTPADPAERKRPPGRPSKPPAHESTDWLKADIVRKILKLALVDKLAGAKIAEILHLTEARISAVLLRASSIESELDISQRAKACLVSFPKRIRDAHAQTFASDIEVKLAKRMSSAGQLCRDGVDLHLRHFDPDQYDVVFKDQKDLKNIRRYLKFLGSLKLDPKCFSWVIRDLDEKDAKLPEWTNELTDVWKPQGTKIIRPKGERGASAYRKWIGILAVDEGGQSMGMAMAKIMFFTRLGLGSSTATVISQSSHESGSQI